MITEEDFIDFACPHCAELVSFPTSHTGSLQECPTCYESLLVPRAQGEPGRKIPVPFSTERLKIRRFQPGDWKDLLEFMSDEETFHYTTGRPLDEDGLLRWLESEVHVKLTTPDQNYCLGMALSDTGKLIGYIAMRIEPELLQAQVTTYLNREYQGKGLATEALRGVLRLCFVDLQLHRVSASCDSRNTAAFKLLERAGLRREGEFVKDTRIQGEWTNTIWYAALREEYTP